MKKILICLLVLGLFIGISRVASAAVQQGDTTLTFSASLYNDIYDGEDTAYWAFKGDITLGRFLTNNFQIEGDLGGIWREYGSWSAYYVYLLIRPNFHFSTESATVPYIGASGGLAVYGSTGSEDVYEVLYGAQAGIKQFIRDNVFLQIEGAYLRYTEEKTDEFSISLGLGFKL